MQTQKSDEMLGLGLAKSEAQAKFNKAKDIRGHEISGLWERNGRFYLQISLPSKGCRRVPLKEDMKATG